MASDTYLLLLALVLIGFGVGASLLSNADATSSTSTPLRKAAPFAAGLEDRHALLQDQSQKSLDAESRRGVLEEVAAQLRPEVPLRAWAGVIASRSTLDRDALLANYSDVREFADGPPFHVLVGPGRKVDPMLRWRRQLNWRVEGLPEPEAWIEVVLLPGADAGFLEELQALLKDNQWTRGGLALREGISKPAQLKEPSK